MLYLFTVLTDRPAPATPAEMTAIDAFNDRMRADGYWIFAGGLEGPENTLLINGAWDDHIPKNPPPIVQRDYPAGLWILDLPDRDVAARVAEEAAKACRRRISVRRFL